MRRAVRVVLLAAVVAAAASAQTLKWYQRTGAGPSARFDHAMVYDSGRSKMVMFGGHGIVSNELGDCWEYGSEWKQVAGGPPARQWHAMAYDSVRGKVVLFGGGPITGFLGDTWEYDGAAWTQVITATNPSPRKGHAMAFDSLRGKVVLHGGWHAPFVQLTDTWEYDGVNWAQVPASTNLPGANGSMTFDPTRGKIVKFSGWSNGAVHEFDGSSWTQTLALAFQPGVNGAGFCWHATRGTCVVFGGQGSGGGLWNDTFEYYGDGVAKLPVKARPLPRMAHAMAYDSARDVVLMFGGHVGSPSGDTWVLGAAGCCNATSIAYGVGCGPPVTMSPAAPPALGSYADVSIYYGSGPLVAVSIGWDYRFIGLGSLGMPGCTLYQTGEVLGLLPSGGSGYATFGATIPYDPSLIGQRAYLQAYVHMPGVNSMNIAVSNGVEWLIAYFG